MYLHGGGTTWMPGTYDPETNTLFWTTSNPSPDFDGSVRPGDNLYTDCVLALDADTGKLKWHFQFTPHDLFDFDATETPILIDTVYQGKPRKLLVQANRNGFIYVLDRTNGKFLSATPFVNKLTWAKGIDAQGRPMRSGLKPTPRGPAYVPAMAAPPTGLRRLTTSPPIWFISLPWRNARYFPQAAEIRRREDFLLDRRKEDSGGSFAEDSGGLRSGQAVDRVEISAGGRRTLSGGTMTTAAGLVFFGDDAQSFEAVDARTGKPLWHFNTGQDFGAFSHELCGSGQAVRGHRRRKRHFQFCVAVRICDASLPTWNT